MPLTTTRICDPKFYTPELPTLSPGCPCRTSRCLFAALWSVFPLLIQDSACRIENIDDIVVALGHRDRGSSNPRCSNLPGSRLENVSVTTQDRFPELTQPDSMLGGDLYHARHACKITLATEVREVTFVRRSLCFSFPGTFHPTR